MPHLKKPDICRWPEPDILHVAPLSVGGRVDTMIALGSSGAQGYFA
jgi:hypothetical protein